MDIFGIGPLEIVLILIIALIVMGPKDMAKAGRTIGRTLRSITTSETWQIMMRFMKEMQMMPNRLMREAQFDDLLEDVNKELKQPISEIKAVTTETNKSLTSLAAWSNPAAYEEQAPEHFDADEIEQHTIAPPIQIRVDDSKSPDSIEPSNNDLDHA